MIPRDRWGRPMVVPPEGGPAVPYTRCTTYVGCLEDQHNLTKWKQRQTAIGLVARPDLIALAAARADDKASLDEICEQAMEAAGASAAAQMGTALHALCEQHDQGIMGTLPDNLLADVEAYSRVMVQAKLTVDQIETFGVIDELKIGGTWDRIVTRGRKRYIADIKTGDIKYGVGKIAMQLAVYAHSRAYDPLTAERADIDVDQERAIVIHLPAGTGKAFLHWVDIAAGWEAVQVAARVRAWRARKGLSEPFEYAKAEPEQLTGPEDPILYAISKATNITELRALWATHNGRWTTTHTQAAEARKKEIT